MWKLKHVYILKEQPALFPLSESLECNAKTEKAVSELTATDLNTENGMSTLIWKLCRIFESEK